MSQVVVHLWSIHNQLLYLKLAAASLCCQTLESIG